MNHPADFFINDAQVPYNEIGALKSDQYDELIDSRYAQAVDSKSIEFGASTCLVKRRAMDSKVLGVDVWEINLMRCERGQAAGLLKTVSDVVPNGALLTCLVDAKNAELLMDLQFCGAIVMGSNISWGFNKNLIDTNLLSTDVGYELLTKDYETSYRACVSESFGKYRSHYHLNTETRGAASNLYVNQVFESTDQNSDVVINTKEDKVVAYSTINFHEEADSFLGAKKAAEIGFSGVDKGEGNKGLYTANVKGTLTEMLERGIEWFFFGTSSSNFAVQRTWITLGLYKPLRFAYRFHWKI